MVTIRKRDNESSSSLVYRFTKRIQQSGILLEARRRRFKHRNENKNKRRASAIFRSDKKKEYLRMKKLGLS